ncbi:MAG: SDR family oxidoreductase [Chitinophagaceae bacterium]|nr:MAG: SDR family oxidoreductase [Chitinophagaceae bacterium]
MNILISGSSRGIGRAIAEYFALKGFNIMICSRDESKLEEAKTRLINLNNSVNVLTFQCDLSKKNEVEDLVDFIKVQWKEVNVFVNNAGKYLEKELFEESDDEFENLLKVNLHSAYFLTKKILPLIPENRKSHIFNMASVAGIEAKKNCGAYSISKFALVGFSKVLREHLKLKGIRVTTLIPGAVMTDSWKGIDIVKERIMEAEDIAANIYNIYTLSEKTVVEEIVYRPFLGDIE